MMARLRFNSRRIRRILTSTAVQLGCIFVLLFFGVKWVILHNHDTTSASPVNPRPTARVDDKRIDWSKLYYVQHVTTLEELCSSLMIWSNIEDIGSRAQRLMLYPSNWDLEERVDGGLTPTAYLLQRAQKDYYVKLRPLDALVLDTTEENIWAGPYTKFLGFNLTEFNRVVAIAAGSVVKYNLDELFLIPAAPIAMPHVYWGSQDGWQFSPQLTIMTPSSDSFSRLTDAIKVSPVGEYDISVLEKVFHGQIIRIPQRPFALLSGELRRKSHDHYIGNAFPRIWNPYNILHKARILYFSDDPIPKPWYTASQDLLNRYMPSCEESEGFGASNCEDRQVWLRLYSDYAEWRKAVCGNDFDPAVNNRSDENLGKAQERVFYPT